MRMCLIPLQTETRNPVANLRHLAGQLEKAAFLQPDLICLPECTLTGYLYDEEDFQRFAEPIPGPTTERMAQFAQAYRVNLCCGVLETTASGVYNTAVLLDRAGDIILTQRKIHESPPFAAGQSVTVADLEGEQMAILICGDLFHEETIQQIDRSLDLLIVPMSRSFSGASPDHGRWLAEERQAYLDAVKAVGISTVIVNARENGVEEAAFGGALVVGPDGELFAESPHGTDELVGWDFARPAAANQSLHLTAYRAAIQTPFSVCWFRRLASGFVSGFRRWSSGTAIALRAWVYTQAHGGR